MLTLDISKYHPKGKEYEVFESLDEVNIGEWEQILDWTLSEQSLDVLLHELYEIPKYQLRMIPREIMDVIDANYNLALSEALEIHEAQEIVEGVSFDQLPYYKWLELTQQAQRHHENPARFLKYLLAIVEHDWEEAQELEQHAESMKERPAVEGLKMVAFFIISDPKFRQLMSRYIPQMTSWLPPSVPVSENDLKNDGD